MPTIHGVKIAIGRSQYQTGFDIGVDVSRASRHGLSNRTRRVSREMSEPGAEGGNHAFPARSFMGSYAGSRPNARGSPTASIVTTACDEPEGGPGRHSQIAAVRRCE